jgi:integrase
LACPPPLSDVATIMIKTGMRPKEVFTLKADKVFFDKCYLQVKGSKTPLPNRKVHFSPKVKNILERRRQSSPKIGCSRKETRPTILNIQVCNFWHLPLVKKLKFDFDLYDCRHTFATRAIERGVDLLTLAALLGHKDTKMLSRYVHPSEDMKREAMQKMGLAKAV